MATPVITWEHFRFYADDNATLNSCTPLADQDAILDRRTGTSYRFIARLGFSNDATANFNEVVAFEYELNNSNTWVQIDTTTSGRCVATTSGLATDDTACDATTGVLTGMTSTTFDPSGLYNDTDGVTSAAAVTKSNWAEYAICCYIVDANVSDNDIIKIRCNSALTGSNELWSTYGEAELTVDKSASYATVDSATASTSTISRVLPTALTPAVATSKTSSRGSVSVGLLATISAAASLAAGLGSVSDVKSQYPIPPSSDAGLGRVVATVAFAAQGRTADAGLCTVAATAPVPGIDAEGTSADAGLGQVQGTVDYAAQGQTGDSGLGRVTGTVGYAASGSALDASLGLVTSTVGYAVEGRTGDSGLASVTADVGLYAQGSSCGAGLGVVSATVDYAVQGLASGAGLATTTAQIEGTTADAEGVSGTGGLASVTDVKTQYPIPPAKTTGLASVTATVDYAVVAKSLDAVLATVQATEQQAGLYAPGVSADTGLASVAGTVDVAISGQSEDSGLASVAGLVVYAAQGTANSSDLASATATAEAISYAQGTSHDADLASVVVTVDVAFAGTAKSTGLARAQAFTGIPIQIDNATGKSVSSASTTSVKTQYPLAPSRTASTARVSVFIAGSQLLPAQGTTKTSTKASVDVDQLYCLAPAQGLSLAAVQATVTTDQVAQGWTHDASIASVQGQVTYGVVATAADGSRCNTSAVDVATVESAAGVSSTAGLCTVSAVSTTIVSVDSTSHDAGLAEAAVGTGYGAVSSARDASLATTTATVGYAVVATAKGVSSSVAIYVAQPIIVIAQGKAYTGSAARAFATTGYVWTCHPDPSVPSWTCKVSYPPGTIPKTDPSRPTFTEIDF